MRRAAKIPVYFIRSNHAVVRRSREHPSYAPMNILAVIIPLFPIAALLSGKAIAADTTAFRGTVTYTITSRGDSADPDMQMFEAFAPVSQRVIFASRGRIRFTENGGLNGGSDVIIDRPNDRHYNLNAEDSIARKLVRTDYEEYFAPTELEPMQETETIDGYTCRKYRIVSSPFVRRGATGHLWLTDEVLLPKERGDYNHEESGFRALLPLPMVLGITSGTVMKLVVTEQGVEVTYIADLEPGEPADDLFMIPAGYRTE